MKPRRPTKSKALQPVKAAGGGASRAVAGGRAATLREVVGMIQDARGRALQAVNTELVELYWRVGGFISGKIETAAWGEGVVDVTPLSTLGVGEVDVTPTEDTTYTITLTRGAEPPVTASVLVTRETGVAAGWDYVDTFQTRNVNAALGGQYPWTTGNGRWNVAHEGTAANNVTQTTAQESLVGFPLGTRRLAVGQSATLFTRFLVPVTNPETDIDLFFGLTDKAVRFGGDWLSNNGPGIRLARTGGGPVTLQTRNGQGSAWTAAAFSIIPGTPCNVWLDVQNVDGVEDIFSVHIGAVGSARTTVFTGNLSDRLPTEVPFLGFPRPVLDTIVLVTPVTAASAPVLFDDLFLSSGNAFNTTEPIPSSLTLVPLPAPFDFTYVNYDSATGSLNLEWSSAPLETFTLQKSTDLTAGSWQTVQTNIPSGGPTTEYFLTVPPAERARHFYRVTRP